MTLHARVTLDAVREQLTAGGYLRARKKRALGLFPTVDHELARPAAVEALQEEARRILRGPTADLPDRDAALGALAAAAELRTLLPRKDRHDTHTEQLIEHSGPASPVLRKIVHEVRGATTAARVATRA